jgi:hypothetical protein
MLTSRDSRIGDLIEWLEMRRQTIDGFDTAADVRDLVDEVRRLREEVGRCPRPAGSSG